MVKERSKVKSSSFFNIKKPKVTSKTKTKPKDSSIKKVVTKTKKSGKKEELIAKKMQKYYKIGLTIFLCAILIGSVHGFYMSYLRDKKHHYYYGSELCNGELLSGDLVASSDDKSLLIYFQAIIKRGKVILTVWDEKGQVVTRFNDWEDMLRQKVVRLNKYDSNHFRFSLECEKAEFDYELQLDIE
jgi:hypothetical protein